MISVRKTVPAFADFNNRTLIQVENEHLLVFRRTPPGQSGASVLVVANFSTEPQPLNLLDGTRRAPLNVGLATDMVSVERPQLHEDMLTIPGLGYYWLTESR